VVDGSGGWVVVLLLTLACLPEFHFVFVCCVLFVVLLCRLL